MLNESSMDLSFFLENFYRANHLPISCFEGRNLIDRGAHHVQDFNLPMLLVSCLPDDLPPVWYSFTPEYMYFGGVKEEKENRLFFIGPVLMNNCSRKQAENILQRIGRKRSDLSSLLRSFSDYANCNASSLIAHLNLLYYILNSRKPGHVEILDFHWSTVFPSVFDSSVELDGTYENQLENNLMSCVHHGNVEKINQIMNEYVLFADHYAELKSTSAIEQQRSYILGANMLASRAAIEEGIDFNLANTLSGHYLDEIMKASSNTDLSLIFADFFRKYTSLVAKLKTMPGQSPLTSRVNSFILSHLYEKITPSIISAHLNMNCSYLCTQFKANTGKTISTYIRECKIEEAKRLLECKGPGNAAISELLCFSSQSYFCSVFKKVTGMTPQEYEFSKK